eukprot:1497792-Pyramimonas_sp.AAC.1
MAFRSSSNTVSRPLVISTFSIEREHSTPGPTAKPPWLVTVQFPRCIHVARDEGCRKTYSDCCCAAVVLPGH